MSSDPTPQMDALRQTILGRQRRSLVAFVIRWTITGLLIAWWFPRYPLLWWTLVLLVPLAAYSLYVILVMPRALLARVDRLDATLRDLKSVADKPESRPE